MENIFQWIGKIFVTIALAITGIFGGGGVAINDNVGATIPVTVAVFETSLQASISASATSMTLVNGTDKAGNALSGYVCFNIDEGTATEEFVCGTASGTSVTSMLRGLDPVDGNLEVTALKKAHRRGASVKVTNYPSLGILSRILNGDETIPNILTYATAPSFSSGSNQLASIKYADDLAIAGSPDASTTQKGISEEATEAQINAGTGAGETSARLFINPSTLLTSIYKLFLPSTGEKDALVGTSGTPGSGNKYVTNDDTSITMVASKVARYNAGGTGIAGIPLPVDIQTFTSNDTWTKPANAKLVQVIVTGGGGGGGSGGGGGNNGGSGGGGGARIIKNFNASELAGTVAVTVGAGGTATNAGGTSSFGTHLLAYGGGGGRTSSTGSDTSGGGGGGSGSAGNAGAQGAGSLGGFPNDTTVGLKGVSGGGSGGVTNAVGLASEYGGASGGGTTTTGAGKAGGSSLHGAGGGGSGGAAGTNAGADGGTSGVITSGGGGAGGATGVAGTNGANGDTTIKAGSGGGGGGSGANGGAGGIPGGGGGGSGGTSGTGGTGGRGEVTVITYF